jgi:YVTN family beta-propeller protein
MSGGKSISIIDTASNEVTAAIAGGPRPYAVALSPDGSSLFVTNQISSGPGTVTVIDTQSNAIVDQVTVGHVPQGVVVGPLAVYAFVTNLWSDTLTMLSLN